MSDQAHDLRQLVERCKQLQSWDDARRSGDVSEENTRGALHNHDRAQPAKRKTLVQELLSIDQRNQGG